MLQSFFRNFFRYDFIIFVLAVVNGLLFVRTRFSARRLNKLLRPAGYLAGGWQDYEKISAHYRKYLNPDGEQELLDSYRKVAGNYTLYENITAVFPLLGILGTVLSLIPLVNSDNIETNLFFAALTSTLWGIVFAIVYKTLNGLLQAEMLVLEDQVNLYVERNTRILVQSAESLSKRSLLKQEQVGNLYAKNLYDKPASAASKVMRNLKISLPRYKKSEISMPSLEEVVDSEEDQN